MVQSREEGGKLIITLSGKIDSFNAPGVETQLQALSKGHPGMPIELDCDQLEYSSSAGLRVILRLKKDVEETVLTNVHSALYEVLSMTGFTEMMEVRKAYRVISVEGCEVIGKGANGKVYRIDPDTIVKVYLNSDALPLIHRERELARLAFVAGIPTAIPYDVVRIEGGGYGSVFELLNAKSFSKLLSSGEKTLEEIAEMSASLLKLIHSRIIQSDILPDIKAVALHWAEYLKDYLPGTSFDKLYALINAVPEDQHLVHGDFHVKNVMMQDGEVLLIDMDTLSHGHPVFELASMYNAYVGFGILDPAKHEAFLGIPHECCMPLWHRSLALYLGTEDEEKVNEVENKAKIVGLTRLIRRQIRRGGLEREEDRKMIEACREELIDILPHVETLVF